MATIGKDIDTAAKLILKGGLVAIPTETVYGLAANALDEQAVLKVFKAKDRPFFDPLIIHVSSLEEVSKYAELDDPQLLNLAKLYWPGPLTLLLPRKEIVPDLVTSGLERVAVRVPSHSMTLELLKKVGVPLAAPSANPFGYVSPTEPAHVEKQLGGKIDYILDGGPCSVGLESTIAGLENGKLCVYRLGGLALEELEKTAGHVHLMINHSSDPKAPGQLKNHYAPKKPLFVGELDTLLKSHLHSKKALICFGNKIRDDKDTLVFDLSRSQDLSEAALNLFKFLRLADESDAEIVLCQKLPDKGLGRAINDRLERASLH